MSLQGMPGEPGNEAILSSVAKILENAVPVVLQVAKFMYILFTQEISTRVTSCQDGESDLNKRYFQLDIS